jgi:hypothetical protein
MKSIFKLFGIIAFIAVIMFVVTTCDSESNEYPYTEHGIWYMGFKSGLYSWSSDQEFDDALDEVTQDYNTNNPSTIDDVTIFNGVTYDIINWQYITGGEPKYVYDAFWPDLYKHNYSVGSCWLFNYVKIPSKGGAGTIYAISAIVKVSEGGGYIRYYASKAALRPSELRSITGLKQANEAPYLLHGKTVLRQDLNKQLLDGSTAPKVK